MDAVNEDLPVEDRGLVREGVFGFAIYSAITIAIVGLVFCIPEVRSHVISGGRDIPTLPPIEQNRVHHPAGFSIVGPVNWRTGDSALFDKSINLYPSGMRRYSASVGVTTHDDRPTELDWSANTTFQGRPAYERMHTHPDGGFENPGQFSYDLDFERDGVWYSMGYHIFSEIDGLPPEVMAFFETFQTHHRLIEDSDALETD